FILKESFKDVNKIDFSLQKNEEVVQKGNTSLMLWKIDALIEYISKYFTIKIGDIIFTGTPSGVAKVNSNDRLTGFIEEKEVFSIKVK
ncbi:MAG: 2-keto-4-pentenoate hydratase/2-oxohepta-3-ene-1,7-dioic acid hydratase in catechol pathway, partial [Ulvibacter sp.]